MTQLMLRSHSLWLVPVAVTLAVFEPDAKKAIAQIPYEFEAVYNTESTSRQIAPNISEVTVLGASADAPYGLTNLESMSYVQLDPDTGVSTFVPDAAAFGLEGLPLLTDKLFGSGDNSLIGTSTGTAVTDTENLTASVSGTLTITGGEGIFTEATGTLSLSEDLDLTLSPDPTAPLIGEALLSGTIEAVPEPEAGIGTLSAIGALGVGFLLRRRSCRVASTASQK